MELVAGYLKREMTFPGSSVVSGCRGAFLVTSSQVKAATPSAENASIR